MLNGNFISERANSMTLFSIKKFETIREGMLMVTVSGTAVKIYKPKTNCKAILQARKPLHHQSTQVGAIGSYCVSENGQKYAYGCQ